MVVQSLMVACLPSPNAAHFTNMGLFVLSKCLFPVVLDLCFERSKEALNDFVRIYLFVFN